MIDEDVSRRISEVLSAESSAEAQVDEEKAEKMEQITSEGEQHKAQLDSLFAQVCGVEV